MSSWGEIAHEHSTDTHFALQSFIISAQITGAKNSCSLKQTVFLSALCPAGTPARAEPLGQPSWPHAP